MKFLRKHLLFSLICCFALATLIFGFFTFRSRDEWYYSTVFLPVNRFWQKVTGFFEVPFYILLLGILIILFIGRGLMSRGLDWKTKLKSWAFWMISGILLIISLFYWMWGFNYAKKTLSEVYFNHHFTEVDSTEFFRRWKLQTRRVNLLKSQAMTPDSSYRGLTAFYSGLYRQKATEILPAFGVDPNLAPHCKEFVPKGWLLRLNTAGFYFPFGSESYVDKALHISQKPFVIAHELAHGYGITDEGEANFIGYLLAQSTSDSYAQYSSALSLWLYMAGDGRKFSPREAKEIWNDLSGDVLKDLEERRRLDERYPDIFPKLRDKIYDSYLSANQVSGGIHSYNRFVQLVLAYENK